MRCKYFSEKILTCYALIDAIYTICPGTGGLAHIVTDDFNVDRTSIEWVIAYCKRPENLDKPEQPIVVLLCEEMLKLPLRARWLLVQRMEFGYDNLDACFQKFGICKSCDIENLILYGEPTNMEGRE